MMKKNVTKPPRRGAESPVAPNNVSSRSRHSPVRIIGARERTPVMNANIPGQRPRSSGTKKPRNNQPEFDDLLSQSARYADNEGDNDSTILNLQGSDLDSLKDIVQSQQKDFEADQAKGRKSPGSMRPHSSNFRARGGNSNNSAKFLYARSGSKEIMENAPDHLSDTTEVEKYISTASSASIGQNGQTGVSDMILKLASQMDPDEIDNAIAVLEKVKSIATLGETSYNSQSSGRRLQSQRRSKSGPPGISPNRPPYLYSSSLGSANVQSTKTENQASFSTIDYTYDDEDEELLEGSELDEEWRANTFRPPSIHNLTIQGRPESEMSVASTINSRASTPMHKRSPTPGLTTTATTIEVSERERQQCPVLYRKQSPKSRGFVEVQKAEFRHGLPGILSRETSGSGLASPRSQANDDVVSVVSSNSSFTAVTANSTGGHSFSRA